MSLIKLVEMLRGVYPEHVEGLSMTYQVSYPGLRQIDRFKFMTEHAEKNGRPILVAQRKVRKWVD